MSSDTTMMPMLSGTPAMDTHYKNRVAVITGGSSGIGLGISHHLATMGAKVVILGRKQERLDAAVAAIAAEGGQAFGYSVDVRDAARVAEVLGDAKAQHGPLDLVVAAAAGNFFVAADTLTPNGFKTVIDIDLIGSFNVFSAALPLSRQPGAVFLAITAPQAQRAMCYQVHACAAKAGVDMMVKCLALEWGRFGVRVNAISPGPIAGTEGLARLSATPEIERSLLDNTALKAFGDVSDIARAVAYLGSPEARYITGTILDCDGGMRLGNFAMI